MQYIYIIYILTILDVIQKSKPPDTTIVRAVNAPGHHHGTRFVAEGIEIAQQMNDGQSLEFDEIQGGFSVDQLSFSQSPGCCLAVA